MQLMRGLSWYWLGAAAVFFKVWENFGYFLHDNSGNCCRPQYNRKKITSKYRLGKIIGEGGENWLMWSIPHADLKEFTSSQSTSSYIFKIGASVSPVWFPWWLDVLASGFSVVRKVKNKSTGKKYACKIIQFPCPDADDYFDQMSRYVQIHCKGYPFRQNYSLIAPESTRVFCSGPSRVKLTQTHKLYVL